MSRLVGMLVIITQIFAIKIANADIYRLVSSHKDCQAYVDPEAGSGPRALVRIGSHREKDNSNLQWVYVDSKEWLQFEIKPQGSEKYLGKAMVSELKNSKYRKVSANYKQLLEVKNLISKQIIRTEFRCQVSQTHMRN